MSKRKLSDRMRNWGKWNHPSDAEVEEVAALEARAESAENDLDWIARASRDEIEQMLMHSVCDDVADLRRFIQLRHELAEAQGTGRD